MKVVISCDELIERTHVTEIVELFCELFPHSELYTLAHKVGAIHGKLEMRKIHSSFLSHKTENRSDLFKYSFSVPSAAKNLFIPCSVDLIINISSGFSHGIKKCDKTKLITYFYSDEYLSKKKKGFFQKIFSSFTKNWSITQLEKADRVYFSTERLESEYSQFTKDHKLLPPSLKLDDFKLFPKGMFANDYVLINTNDLTLEAAKSLSSLLKDLKIKYRFVGLDDHLLSLKQDNPELFLGKKCVGEMAPIYAGSQFYLDFTKDEFPSAPLSCLATGRPVIVADSPFSKDVLKGEGVTFVNPNDFSGLKEKIVKLQSEAEEFEGGKLRAQTNKFNEIRFKSRFKKEIEALMN